MVYYNESDLWLTDKEITNSAGNLCLDLIGNLITYIGGALANSNYTRNRPKEFTQKKKFYISIDNARSKSYSRNKPAPRHHYNRVKI